MMDHIVKNIPKKLEDILNSHTEILQDGIIDEKESQMLGLEGNRRYDLKNKEDLRAFENDLKNRDLNKF